MNMDEERDLVVFEDDAGNELTMEVLDYLAYEGKEYALLTEYVEDDEDGDEDEPVEVFIMEVRPVGEDQEEFVPVDEDLAETLIKIFESKSFQTFAAGSDSIVISFVDRPDFARNKNIVAAETVLRHRRSQSAADTFLIFVE